VARESLLAARDVGRRPGGGLLNRRLRVASGDDARDQTEEASQRRFRQPALQACAHVAAGEAAEADGDAQAPLRGAVAAMNELERGVGRDADDRRQEGGEQRGGRDLVGGEARGDEDRGGSEPPPMP
jgi:hypothetical protein